MGNEDRIRAMVGQRPAVPEYIHSPEPSLVIPGAARALGAREYHRTVQSLLNPLGLEPKSDANTHTPAWRPRIAPRAVQEPWIPPAKAPPAPSVPLDEFAAGGFTSPTKILTSKRSDQMAGSPGLLSGLMG